MKALRTVMRFITPWLIAILSAAIGVWIVWSSKPFEYCASNGYHDSAKQQLKENVALGDHFLVYRDCVGEFVHANGDAIIAAFTVILAFSTIALWAATKRLVRGAEQTAERQLRAYVGISGLSVDVFEANKKVMVNWTRKNYGNTPADRFKTWTEMEIVADESKIARFRPKFSPRDIGAINPGAHIRSESTTEFDLTEDQIARINDKTLTLYFFGAFKYFDAFGYERTTEFRHFFIPPFRSGYGMGVCRKGNRAD